KPIMDQSRIYDTLVGILKQLDKNNYGRTNKRMSDIKISRTISFFEDLLGVQSLAFDDISVATRTLFALSKNNYTRHMVTHYLNKIGLEPLAQHVTGVEQAKFIMDAFNTDPITMSALIEKESIKTRLIESIASM